MARFSNYYNFLYAPHNATNEQIRSRIDLKQNELTTAPNEADSRNLEAAKKILLDPKLKKEYDKIFSRMGKNPEPEIHPDYYEMLGVSPHANSRQIDNAIAGLARATYERMEAMRQAPPSDSAALMQQTYASDPLNYMSNILNSSSLKKAYDAIYPHIAQKGQLKFHTSNEQGESQERILGDKEKIAVTGDDIRTKWENGNEVMELNNARLEKLHTRGTLIEPLPRCEIRKSDCGTFLWTELQKAQSNPQLWKIKSPLGTSSPVAPCKHPNSRNTSPGGR